MRIKILVWMVIFVGSLQAMEEQENNALKNEVEGAWRGFSDGGRYLMYISIDQESSGKKFLIDLLNQSYNEVTICKCEITCDGKAISSQEGLKSVEVVLSFI